MHLLKYQNLRSSTAKTTAHKSTSSRLKENAQLT